MNAFLYPVPAQSAFEGEQIIVQYGREWIPILLDIVLRLKNPSLWESPPDDLDEFIHDLSYALITETTTGGEMPYIGEVRSFAFLPVPNGWLICSGDSLLRADYPELFATIGTVFGAADGDHFSIPQLQGRFVAGYWFGAGDYALGHMAGEESVSLTVPNLPAHNHTGVVSPNNPVSNRAVVATGGVQTVRTAGTSDSVGDGTGHENRPPYTTLAKAIFTGVLTA